MNRSVLCYSLSLVVAALLFTIHVSAAEEAKKAAVDPSGTWRWEHDEGGETVKDVLKLNYDGKKLTGTFQGRRGPIEIVDAKIEEDKLTFGFSVEYDERTLKIKFAGIVKADKVDGTVTISSSEGSQDFPWTAQRSLHAIDVVGTWKLAIELPDGNVLTPQLKLKLDDEKKELAGEYTSDNAELEVSEIKVKDDKLFFNIRGDFDGATLTATYKVQPRGDKLAGEVEYDFNGQTGELEVKGKREAEKKDEK